MKRIGDEIIGQKYGRLTILGFAPSEGKGTRVTCDCDCGQRVVRLLYSITGGSTSSCGCRRSEVLVKKATRHGHSKNRKMSDVYRAWVHMNTRCHNQNIRGYKHYGGRGITVCARWKVFENFLEDMGPKPSPSHSLDRFPNGNGNYEPGNARWATKTEQVWNRRNSLMIEIDGTKKPLTVWALEFGIPKLTVWNRFKRGWPTDKLFMPPLRGGKLNQ